MQNGYSTWRPFLPQTISLNNTQNRSGRLLLLIILFLTNVQLFAQDVIIKVDKEEIKAKVIEINQQVVKYKRFDSLDGPIYNVTKDQVFIIIYQNGRRETFTQSASAIPAVPSGSEAKEDKPETIISNKATPKPMDKKFFLDGPVRMLLFFSSSSIPDPYHNIYSDTYQLQFQVEKFIIPNYFTVGLSSAYGYTFISGTGSTENYQVGSLGVYGAGYLPLNRIILNSNKPKLGFFPYVRLGMAYTHISDNKGASTSGTGSFFAAGIDYRFTPNFGLTIESSKSLNIVGLGLNVIF